MKRRQITESMGVNDACRSLAEYLLGLVYDFSSRNEASNTLRKHISQEDVTRLVNSPRLISKVGTTGFDLIVKQEEYTNVNQIRSRINMRDDGIIDSVVIGSLPKPGVDKDRWVRECLGSMMHEFTHALNDLSDVEGEIRLNRERTQLPSWSENELRLGIYAFQKGEENARLNNFYQDSVNYITREFKWNAEFKLDRDTLQKIFIQDITAKKSFKFKRRAPLQSLRLDDMWRFIEALESPMCNYIHYRDILRHKGIDDPLVMVLSYPESILNPRKYKLKTTDSTLTPLITDKLSFESIKMEVAKDLRQNVDEFCQRALKVVSRIYDEYSEKQNNKAINENKAMKKIQITENDVHIMTEAVMRILNEHFNGYGHRARSWSASGSLDMVAVMEEEGTDIGDEGEAESVLQRFELPEKVNVDMRVDGGIYGAGPDDEDDEVSVDVTPDLAQLITQAKSALQQSNNDSFAVYILQGYLSVLYTLDSGNTDELEELSQFMDSPASDFDPEDYYGPDEDDYMERERDLYEQASRRDVRQIIISNILNKHWGFGGDADVAWAYYVVNHQGKREGEESPMSPQLKQRLADALQRESEEIAKEQASHAAMRKEAMEFFENNPMNFEEIGWDPEQSYSEDELFDMLEAVEDLFQKKGRMRTTNVSYHTGISQEFINGDRASMRNEARWDILDKIAEEQKANTKLEYIDAGWVNGHAERTSAGDPQMIEINRRFLYMKSDPKAITINTESSHRGFNSYYNGKYNISWKVDSSD